MSNKKGIVNLLMYVVILVIVGSCIIIAATMSSAVHYEEQAYAEETANPDIMEINDVSELKRMLTEQKEIIEEWLPDTNVKETLLSNISEMNSVLCRYGEITEIDSTEPIDENVVEEVVEEIVEDFYHESFSMSYNVMQPSGLTAEQIDILLEGTGLYGIGDAVKSIEEQYGVNAFYTISVASLESSRGTSSLARNRNNIFGISGYSFDSFSECVEYFGGLMNRYSTRMDMNVSRINDTYCTNPQWKYDVNALMNSYLMEANEKF